MVPLSPVKYCRQPCGAFSLLLHSTWVTCTPPAHHLLTTWHLAPWLTLMVKALVVAVLADPNTADSSLHWSLAWTYMW